MIHPENLMPALTAQWKLYDMNTANHYAAKQGETPPFTDDEIQAQRETLRRLKDGR